VKHKGINFIVAIAAFLIGIASASAIHHDGFKVGMDGISSTQSDVMGNACPNHD
jgi:hypothetical protein